MCPSDNLLNAPTKLLEMRLELNLKVFEVDLSELKTRWTWQFKMELRSTVKSELFVWRRETFPIFKD